MKMCKKMMQNFWNHKEQENSESRLFYILRSIIRSFPKKLHVRARRFYVKTQMHNIQFCTRSKKIHSQSSFPKNMLDTHVQSTCRSIKEYYKI